MKQRNRKALVINAKDNVATALEDLSAGITVMIRTQGLEKNIVLKDSIPAGHKFAISDIAIHGVVTKYGEVIGQSIHLIPKGSHVHVHNVVSPQKRESK